MNAPNSETSDIVIYRANFLPYLLMFFGAVISPLSMVIVFRKGDLLYLGLSALGVAGVLIGWYFVKHRPIMIQFSPKGLYTRQYDLTIPWALIDLADVIQVQAGAQSGVLLGLRLTEEGRRTYTECMPALMRRQFPDWDLVIRSFTLDFSSIRGVPGLVEAIHERLPKAGRKELPPSTTI